MTGVGKGVKVDVGGNQTIVAVAVAVGGRFVLVGSGGSGVAAGKQALNPANKMNGTPITNQIQRER